MRKLVLITKNGSITLRFKSTGACFETLNDLHMYVSNLDEIAQINIINEDYNE